MENTVAFTLRRPSVLERRRALMSLATEKLFKPVCPIDNVTQQVFWSTGPSVGMRPGPREPG